MTKPLAFSNRFRHPVETRTSSNYMLKSPSGEELAKLDRELREAVREKRLFDLPPRIERVLTLKPDHPYAKELAEQVWSRLTEAVEKRLADYRHDKALQLLDRVVPNCGSPRLEELRRQAAELAWLNFDLRNAPAVDGTLVAVGKRLRAIDARR